MICLLRCISRKLCCTSILQHPREPRPLAAKRSRSRRATTEEDERVAPPTEPVDAFNQKREANGYAATMRSVIVNGNEPSGTAGLRGQSEPAGGAVAERELYRPKIAN